MIASFSSSIPSTLVYRVKPERIASRPACAMCSGVSKSGSPAPRPITSLPSALSRAARAVTARVGEGLTRWTRRASAGEKVTEFPAVRFKSGAVAILRDCLRLDHLEGMRPLEQRPFKLEADFAPAGDQP